MKAVLESSSKAEKSSRVSRRSQSQNWMPAEISEMQKCANISDQASIADWADILEPLGSLDCSGLFDGENSNKGDAEEAIRADDELRELQIVLSSPVENKTLDQLDIAFIENSMSVGREIGTLSKEFEHLQTSEIINIKELIDN